VVVAPRAQRRGAPRRQAVPQRERHDHLVRVSRGLPRLA
jgi:hypothetical protein